MATRSRKKAQQTSNGSTDAIRRLLTEQRKEMLDLYEHDLRVGQASGGDGAEDIVDRANNAYNREFMFSLSDNERQVLLQIEGALERIDGGTYGTCDHCGDEIPKARMKAVPWAGYCVDCQEQSELGALNEA